MNSPGEKTDPWFLGLVSVAKDVVALLRDVVLFGLALSLIVFPARVNAILVEAGFQEASIAGITWKSHLVESNTSLQEAAATISSLRNANEKLLRALDDAKAGLADPALSTRVAELTEQNTALLSASSKVQKSVADTLKANVPLVEKAFASREPAAASVSKADLAVGLQTLGFSDDERNKLNSLLHSEGYGLDDLGAYTAHRDHPDRRIVITSIAHRDRSAATGLGSGCLSVLLSA